MGIFLIALVLRLLFLYSTPDIEWAHSAWYKGDAPLWLSYAEALKTGRNFEEGLPLRPPGNAYLIHWLWDGSTAGIVTLKQIWCFLGALMVALFSVAIRNVFGALTALLAGLWMSASTGLMILSTSLNNETPYLLLLAASLVLWPKLGVGAVKPGALTCVAWGALSALACLFRVEHALFFALATGYWIIRHIRSPADQSRSDQNPSVSRSKDRERRSKAGRKSKNKVRTGPFAGNIARRSGRAWPGQAWPFLLIFSSYFLVLAPWHLKAWEACRQFNRQEPLVNPATEAAFRHLESRLDFLRWTPGAEAKKHELPAYARRTAVNLVAATVAQRGRLTVEAGDFEILEEAFGVYPAPIAERPFIALYGGLNFWLANQLDSAGGFTRRGLELAPPMAGGRELYPSFLVAGLPPPDLAFTYPPHAAAVHSGYSLGWRNITQSPAAFADLCRRKLGIFWGGVSYGFGVSNAPMGLSGLRRKVDMVVPDPGLGFGFWQFLTLGILILGLGHGWRKNPEALIPWLAFLGLKIVVTVSFFGYARQGATMIPLVALTAGLLGSAGLERISWGDFRKRKAFTVWLLLLSILLTSEAWRAMSTSPPSVDGRAISASDPWPMGLHEDRRLGH